jgi:hypothetical protein
MHVLNQIANMGYTVSFSNEVQASAPARHVVIVDELNTTLFDVRSVALQGITIGDSTLLFADGAYGLTYDMRPRRNVIVKVAASADTLTGKILWDFMSIDPATGLPTEDPGGGFLPPDSLPPAGEGAVLFSIHPVMGAGSGTVFQNTAKITFDANAPMYTAAWVNALDNAAPRSYMIPLRAREDSALFRVVWGASDDVSGVAAYAIYVAVNSESPSLWQFTGDTSAVYRATRAGVHSFWSVAIDSVGNREIRRLKADASTFIDTTVGVLASSSVSFASSDSVGILWQVAGSVGKVRVEADRNWQGWQDRGFVEVGSNGETRFTDHAVTAGDSIGYRLRSSTGLEAFGEIWVRVPAAVEFGLRLLSGNPSIGGAVIRCGLPTAGRGRLDVYDVAGRRVKTIPLVAGGPVWLDTDLRGALSGGVYFARLNFLKATSSLRLVVVR